MPGMSSMQHKKITSRKILKGGRKIRLKIRRRFLTTCARLCRLSLPSVRRTRSTTCMCYGRVHCDLLREVGLLWRWRKKTVKPTPAHPYIAIFELGHPYEHTMIRWKFRDDISNRSRVIVLTDRQTNKRGQTQTGTTKNNKPHATLRGW